MENTFIIRKEIDTESLAKEIKRLEDVRGVEELIIKDLESEFSKFIYKVEKEFADKFTDDSIINSLAKKIYVENTPANNLKDFISDSTHELEKLETIKTEVKNVFENFIPRDRTWNSNIYLDTQLVIYPKGQERKELKSKTITNDKE